MAGGSVQVAMHSGGSRRRQLRKRPFLGGLGTRPPGNFLKTDAWRRILVHSGAVEKPFNQTSNYAKKPVRAASKTAINQISK